MLRLPSLGPRGEGWVALQVVSLAFVGWADALVPGRLPGLMGTIPWLFGFALVVVAIALAIRGYLDLRASRAFTAFPYPRPDSALVETGVYRLVRHPLYAGLILGAFGIALVRASLATIVAAAVLFVVLDLKRRREEQWLSERFPGYTAYRGRTRALVPFLY
jgi:protein-S-isoprenylcysteine O-methyltransferase Ste14